MSFHAPRDPQPNTEPRIAATVELEALPALLTVAEVAEILRVARSWVYQHAGELGAVKLGTGQTAPLRIPRDGLQQIVGVPPPRRQRRSIPARRAREAQAAAGELRARPRL